MYQDQEKLVDALISENLLTEEAGVALQKKAIKQGSSPEEIIMEDRLIDPEEFIKVKSKLINIPVADLAGIKISKKILNIIPQEVAENYQIIAFDKKGNEVHLGMIDPQDFKAIEAVEFLAQKSRLKIKYFIITPNSFSLAFHQYQILGEEVEEALASFDDADLTQRPTGKDLQKMEQVIKSAPVSKMVLVIIRHAIDGHASDIHIEPTLKDTKVRYRIDGILRTSLVLPKYIHAAVVARIKVLANLKLDESRKPQDGRIRLTIEGRDIDFRVSTLPLFEGEKVVLRILDTTSSVPKLKDLGFNDVFIEYIEAAIRQPHGLTLLTGPTGSGKTTTLYTILTMLNQEGANIITLEDPIEYYINGVNQSQINPAVGYTFAFGLRAILRQDPNIVMVGEIRDKETTELVVHASLTGHMMLSTLHTNDAVGAIPRLIDLGAEPFLLSSIINLIIAQRLARKICPDCKVKIDVPEKLMARVKSQLASTPKKFLADVDTTNLEFYKGQGCAHCGGLGYQGRMAVAEIINITPEIRRVINNGGDAIQIEELLKKQDFITLMQDCLLKAIKGQTTLDEVIRVSQL